MLTPQQLFTRLDQLGIAHRTVEHPPLFTVEESNAIGPNLPGHHIKNLFLRNKKEEMWLVVALHERVIDLKKLGEILGAGRLSFGSPERLLKHLGVTPGSVTPFSLVNDPEHKVRVAVDRSILEGGPVNAHPLLNTMTTSVSAQDLQRFFEATGHQPLWLDFPIR